MRVVVCRHLRHRPRDSGRQSRILQIGHGDVSDRARARVVRHDCRGRPAGVGPRPKATAWSSSAFRAAASARTAIATRPFDCRERREVGVIGQDGAYAAYLVTRARYVHRVPASVTLAQAALAEPLAVVIKGMRRLGSIPRRRSVATMCGHRGWHHRAACRARPRVARSFRHGHRSRAIAARSVRWYRGHFGVARWARSVRVGGRGHRPVAACSRRCCRNRPPARRCC